MDILLKTMLSSNESPEVKQQFIEGIIAKAGKPISSHVCMNIFEATSRWVTSGHPNQLPPSWGRKVFVAFAENNTSTLEQFVTPDRMQLWLSLTSNDIETWPETVRLIRNVLSMVFCQKSFPKLAHIVQRMVIIYLREHPDIKVVLALEYLMTGYKACMPVGEFTDCFCATIVHVLALTEIPLDPKKFTEVVNDVEQATKFLYWIWKHSDHDTVMHSLDKIYKLISQSDPTFQPSIALGNVIQGVPAELADKMLNQISNADVEDEKLSNVLNHMINWMAWPLATTASSWVIALLRSLSVAEKDHILIEVTNDRICQIFEKLNLPVFGPRYVAVLSEMLLSYQHSPEAFHKIVQDIPRMVKEIPPENSGCLQRLTDLTHILLRMHPGFPDLYQPIVVCLQNYPPPSFEHMDEHIRDKKWHMTPIAELSCCMSSVLANRSETGKTGLVNLGNTCYMNSVLQTLYMCDDFRNHILNSSFNSNSHKVTRALQFVFAFLTSTHRSAYQPREFLHTARPEWFEPGTQQDCSEFLRYLLDQIHEEDVQGPTSYMSGSFSTGRLSGGGLSAAPQKKQKQLAKDAKHLTSARSTSDSECVDSRTATRQSFVSAIFGGAMERTCHCLKCGTESTTKEHFTDIPLAFPEDLCSPSHGSNDSSLKQLINFFFKPEKMDGENKYFCSSCSKLQNAERRIQVTSAPNYLIISLLRFSYDPKTHAKSKILIDVAYPLTLNLPTVLEMKQTEIAYSLCAVIVHSGLSSECGHYYCYCRSNSHTSIGNGEAKTATEDVLLNDWLCFNDERVTFTNYDRFGSISKLFPHDTPYLLVYKQIDTLAGENAAPPPHLVPLKKELQDIVSKDNADLLKEQETEIQRRRRSSCASATSSVYRNDKSDGAPPGSCGGGSGFSMHGSNPFVF